MNSDSQSWNHYKKIRQQGKCTCTRLHKATFRNYTYVLNSGDPWTVSFIQTTLPSHDLVKCAGDRKIILCRIGKDQDSWIIWESLTYYMHVLVLTY